MSRSNWKNNFMDYSILKLKNNKKILIWSRRSVIPTCFLNKTVFVHNGKSFKKIFINREKIGFKFGEFAPTRFYLKLKKTTKKTTKKTIKKK